MNHCNAKMTATWRVQNLRNSASLFVNGKNERTRFISAFLKIYTEEIRRVFASIHRFPFPRVD